MQLPFIAKRLKCDPLRMGLLGCLAGAVLFHEQVPSSLWFFVTLYFKKDTHLRFSFLHVHFFPVLWEQFYQ